MKLLMHSVHWYHSLHDVAENWSWARDVNGRGDRDVCLSRPRRDQDVDNFSRDETETRRWYVSTLESRDHLDRDVDTQNTTLVTCLVPFALDLFDCGFRVKVSIGSVLVFFAFFSFPMFCRLKDR